MGGGGPSWKTEKLEKSSKSEGEGLGYKMALGKLDCMEITLVVSAFIPTN